MHRLLIALSFCAACTATVRTAGPPPAEPAGPPPAPPPTQPVATQPAPPPAQPMPPPPAAGHPAYVDATVKLRQARAMLQRSGGGAGDVKWDEKVAVGEIEAALREIKEARQDDGRPWDEHPPLDSKMMYRDRLREAGHLLDQAMHDIAEREDNVWAKKDRQQAADHIRRAAKAVHEAIGDRASDAAGPPPPPAAPPAPPPANAHPAYAMALGNLRHARALLERPAGAADVKWDEKMAITEIDAAIKEARDARMDDGVPMTEHPPIDNKMVYRDRIREALKLLGDSAKDLEEREDNAWAKKDRKQAVEHVRRAEKSVREAMSDRKADVEEKKEEKAEKKAAKGH